MLNHCLLIVALMLPACKTLEPQLKPQIVPPLDASLAQPCRELKEPERDDYDVWLEWIVNDVLRAYGDCASRHAATVNAWPK